MRNYSAADVVQTIRKVVGDRPGTVALHEPQFHGNELAYVKDCVESGWVSSLGSYINKFEDQLAAFTGVNRAIAIVNGTAALHLCFQLVGVGRDEEVIAPTLTFIATANAISYCGAIPNLVDVDTRTLGVDPQRLSDYLNDIVERTPDGCRNRFTGRRIAAVVCMHTFGHPCDMDALMEVCRRHGLPMVEDAAESLGSYYKGKHTGGQGVVAAMSFNGNKIVTTGGGGAILTNDPELGRRAKHLSTTARVPHQWSFIHDEVGYNYRMPNLNAALGCAQLEQLPGFLEKKRRLAENYRQAFAGVPGVSFFVEPPQSSSNYWLNAILVDESWGEGRDEILKLSNDSKLMTRPAWTLMHKLPLYADVPRMSDLSVAEGIERRLINIPSSPFLAA